MPIVRKPKPVTEKQAETFIHGADESKQPAKSQGKRSVMLRFDTQLLETIDAAAARRFQSRTAYITAAVVDALNRDDLV